MCKKILYYGVNANDFLSYHQEPERTSAFRIYPLSKLDISVDKKLTIPKVDAIIIDDCNSADIFDILVNSLSSLGYPIYFWLDFRLYDEISKPDGFESFIVSLSKLDKLSLLYDAVKLSKRNSIFFYT